MNKLNLMKRLLWVMIAMFLLQPVFSSLQIQDHSTSHSLAVQSVLLVSEVNAYQVATKSEDILESKISNVLAIDTQQDALLSSHTEQVTFVDCCQSADMSFCLMGCYFIPFTNASIVMGFKPIPPSMASIFWASFEMNAENPPPRLIV